MLLSTAAESMSQNEFAWTQILAAVGTVVAVLIGLLAIADRFRKWIDERMTYVVSRLADRVEENSLILRDHEQRISRLEGKTDG